MGKHYKKRNMKEIYLTISAIIENVADKLSDVIDSIDTYIDYKYAIILMYIHIYKNIIYNDKYFDYIEHIYNNISPKILEIDLNNTELLFSELLVSNYYTH